MGIVRNHRGGVELRTSTAGTAFTVAFPSPPLAQPATASTAPAKAEQLVLVVDDEPMVQRIVQLSLERAGYRVVMAGSGEEALRLLEGPASSAAMVLLDVSLPGMDGEQTFAKIREKTGAHVMFCSGYAASDSIREVIESSGAASFMQKPYRPTALVAAVDGVIRPR
jgi:CheY-like chemotaxis protein